MIMWLQDGVTWLLLPPKKSLAFLLADNGFDVWIANSRGTKFSRGHTSLTSNDSVSFVQQMSSVSCNLITHLR